MILEYDFFLIVAKIKFLIRMQFIPILIDKVYRVAKDSFIFLKDMSLMILLSFMVYSLDQ